MSDTHIVKVWRDIKGEWRWTEVSSSDITSESGEGYINKQDAIDQAKAHAPEGVEVVVEGE